MMQTLGIMPYLKDNSKNPKSNCNNRRYNRNHNLDGIKRPFSHGSERSSL